jgi:hypothetical protein
MGARLKDKIPVRVSRKVDPHAVPTLGRDKYFVASAFFQPNGAVTAHRLFQGCPGFV